MDKDFGTNDDLELEYWLEPNDRFIPKPPLMDESDQLDD